MIAEPEALTARVAAAKTEIDAITAELGGDPATVDLKKHYVAALVARRHLDEVWNGFARTKGFMDCLCRSLTCWTKTSDAVSVLTGCKAVKDCQEQARRKHCEDLAQKTVEEVLLEYERLCGTDSCEDDDDPSDDGDDHGGTTTATVSTTATAVTATTTATTGTTSAAAAMDTHTAVVTMSTGIATRTIPDRKRALG